jgi:hypothetical protein
MRGQSPIVINDFRGKFSRGPQENCPLNYFPDCQNLEFEYRRFQTRGEFLSSHTFTAFAGNIIGLYAFPRLDGTLRRLILHRQSAGPNTVRLIDLDHSAPPFTVASYTSDIDAVSVVPMYDRLYIAALTTNNEHKLDAKVQVYDGTSVARNAAGLAPAGASMVATQPGAGNVSAGIHLYAVAFETPSGFITKAGPAAWTNFTSSGVNNINLAGIPTGPAGTTARHILATKTIPTYGPPQENFELFFVETINDNVTVTLTFDFFDTELVNSADYLLDQYEEIPAGPLFSIGNSLGVAGFKESSGGGIGASTDKTSIALISKAVEIEAFSVDEGFVVVNPSRGGPLTNALDINGTLYFFKESLTAAIQPNLDVAPAEWGSPGVIDTVIGTTPFGIAQYMGAPFLINGGAFIATRFGLQHFNGSYNNLSLVIEGDWKDVVSFKLFKNTLAAVDPERKRVHVFLSKGVGYADTYLVMDYKDGFTPDTVKWCPWVASTLNLRGFLTTHTGILQACGASNLYTLQTRTPAVTEIIVSYAKTARLAFSEYGYIYMFEQFLIRGRGVGVIQADWFSMDDVKQDLLMPDITMALTTDRYMKRLANFSSQMASLKLTTSGVASNYMDVSSIVVFGHQESEEFPE